MSTTKKLAKAKKTLEEFKDSLRDKSVEELEKIEQEIIKEADDIDAEIAKTTFKVDAENYETVAKNIQMFLETQSVQWNYTLGLVTMYEFWDPEKKPDVVEYPMLDQTLRTLGSLQFKGYTEWKAVIAINDFFESAREKYVELNNKIMDVANRHSAVLDAMEMHKPVQTVQEKPAE